MIRSDARARAAVRSSRAHTTPSALSSSATHSAPPSVASRWPTSRSTVVGSGIQPGGQSSRKGATGSGAGPSRTRGSCSNWARSSRSSSSGSDSGERRESVSDSHGPSTVTRTSGSELASRPSTVARVSS
ncbi:hypothetical protein [Nonomuraea recticatena]|uniref:hypothetical protein n=1 Tax=Nonomuraea recticatena TaxID=46178 RepID=UPI0036234FF1